MKTSHVKILLQLSLYYLKLKSVTINRPLLRSLLSFVILILSLFWLLYWLYQGRLLPIPLPEVRVVVLDPYADNPLLQSYKRFRDALLGQDVAALQGLLAEETVRGSYLEHQTALTLARMPNLTAAQRLPYYQHTLDTYLEDPLTKNDKRDLWLEYAKVAEQASDLEVAGQAYSEALPFADAISGLHRVESDSYKLANAFYNARMYTAALEVLGTNTAPSIEAPSYRWTNQNDKALDAYERWSAEVPSSTTAILGKGWVFYRLGRYTEADAVFANLSSPEAYFGRAMVAEQQGDIDSAINYYLQSNDATHIWKATALLEQVDRIDEAIDAYLKIAQYSSTYKDDAAFRALVLAEQQGDTETIAKAQNFLPKLTFFRIARGESINIPFGAPLPPTSHYTIDLARALESVGDYQAATGELAFALKTVRDESTVVAIATELQRLGEYRQSSRAAENYLNNGNWNLRTWQLAYPRAYADNVYKEAIARNLEPELVWAIMREESRFYPRAVSRSNARGLMQFISSTWDWMAELLNESPADPFNPPDNIRYGAHYLQWLVEYFDGDLELVVPSYNGGQGYIRRLYEGATVNGDKEEFYRHIDKSETREYLQKVLLSYEIYKVIY